MRPKEVYRLGNKNKGISLSYRVAYQYAADRNAQMASNFRTVTLKKDSDYSGELYLVTKVNGVEKYTVVNSGAAALYAEACDTVEPRGRAAYARLIRFRGYH